MSYQNKIGQSFSSQSGQNDASANNAASAELNATMDASDKAAANPSATPQNPFTGRVQVAGNTAVTTFAHNELLSYMQLPYPGIVIFVHGVNSEGEWFKAAEDGLCRGLNQRLGRAPGQLVKNGKEVGQLAPASYMNSLTPDGFLNPKLSAKNYQVEDPDTYSPVIHFRWGYKADGLDLKKYGDKVFLNEQNYWGGGPFANGCGSLADLWHQGIDPRILGCINVQDLNPTNRPVYETPARAYNVVAALRLAKLIQSIREQDKDAPITVVCHSQGNMVGMTAAFLGEQLMSRDEWNPKKVRCIADTYVLANAPYSLLGLTGDDSGMFMDSWTQRKVKDMEGHVGRVTKESKAATLTAFFDLIAKSKEREDVCMSPDMVEHVSNLKAGSNGDPLYKPSDDRKKYGVQNPTFGRVTLYSCPHDQVISAAPLQGIGWRGISDKELSALGLNDGNSSFRQRVFAS